MSSLRAGPGTALLLDAAGTLLHPAEPVAATYAAHARAHSVEVGEAEVRERLGPSMSARRELRRGAPDWRPYWAAVIEDCTGSRDPELLADLVAHFRRAAAWTLSPGALRCCEAIRAAGMKIAVVSNWDHNLRALVAQLGLVERVDALVISGEEGVEKPAPSMFTRACARLGVAPERSVHVGDDLHDDFEGARAAGCQALLFGRDVANFAELERRLLLQSPRA